MQSKPVVSIAGREGAFQNVKNAFQNIDISHLKGKTVLLKPNIGRVASPEHGYNTHPQTIAALIEVLRDAGAVEIAIGESPIVGVDTFKAFQRAGITNIADRYGVELIDFNSKPPIVKNIPQPRILKNTKICQQVYDFDFLISVPVAKTHMHTGVTLGIKNMKGCLYRHEKVRYHQLEYVDHVFPEKTLDSAISDLATILLPDMVVVDGYIGMEGLGPSGGNPVKSDFVVVSENPMAADVYACLLMGIDPESIPHLKIISKRNKLSQNPEKYKAIPEDFLKYKHPYKNPPKEISLEFENVCAYDKESCSSCLSTLMMFLKRFNDDLGPYLLDDGKFHIAIGKGVRQTKKGTVFVGNCTREHRDEGIFVKGCPPVPTRIFEAIAGIEPDKNEPEVD